MIKQMSDNIDWIDKVPPIHRGAGETDQLAPGRLEACLSAVSTLDAGTNSARDITTTVDPDFGLLVRGTVKVSSSSAATGQQVARFVCHWVGEKLNVVIDPNA